MHGRQQDTICASIWAFTISPSFAGFMNYQSLMKLKEVVAGVWQGTMSDGERVRMILTERRCIEIILFLEAGKFPQPRLKRMALLCLLSLKFSLSSVNCWISFDKRPAQSV